MIFTSWFFTFIFEQVIRHDNGIACCVSGSVMDVIVSIIRVVVQFSIAEKHNLLLCGSMIKIIMRILIQISSWPFDWKVSTF